MDSSWLSIVSKNHKHYIRLVNSWGEYEYAEDLVQEMYLRLYRLTTPERIIKDNEVNKSFVWITLKNMHLQLVRERKKMNKINIDEFTNISDTDNTELFEALNRLDEHIKNECDSWHWYDTMLFKLYINSEMSMRDVSTETGISLTSIFETLKKCKERLTFTTGEHYEDIRNKDYERV